MRVKAPARSDQINADDFIGGPGTFTIAGVKDGKAEALYDIALVETPGKSWRPPLTVLRLLMAAWTDESDMWIGRRVTLYRDPTIRMSGEEVGGIRVSHMSDLPGGKPFKERVTASRGKKVTVSAQPLIEEAPTTPTPEPTAEQVAACTDKAVLDAMWRASGPERRAQIEARAVELADRDANVGADDA